MPSAAYVNTLLFGVYPYVCLAVLLIGSLIRFDREPYTWKSDSSQMLRAGQLRLGSNLFHYGVIVVILGHFVGFLAPDWAVDWALTPVAHQLLAMVVGGIAGLVAIVGLTILDRAALRRSPYPPQQPQMGYRRHLHAVAATRAGHSHGSSLRLSYGRRLVRDADDLREGCRDVQWRGSSADGRMCRSPTSCTSFSASRSS